MAGKIKSKGGMAGGKKTKGGMAGGKKTKMGMRGGMKTKMGMAGGRQAKMVESGVESNKEFVKRTFGVGGNTRMTNDKPMENQGEAAEKPKVALKVARKVVRSLNN